MCIHMGGWHFQLSHTSSEFALVKKCLFSVVIHIDAHNIMYTCTYNCLLALTRITLVVVLHGYGTGATTGKKNVLFFVSDDLRPQLGVYAQTPYFPSSVHPTMYTPNIDKLASNSLLLSRAYVQQAVCSPSRTSFLTGRRPDTTHVYDLKKYFRNVGGNFTTLPQYFKEHGYISVGMGKIFHPGRASGHDDPISWSVPYYTPPNKGHWTGSSRSWYAVPKEERMKTPLPDEQSAVHARESLRLLAPDALSGKRPFFLAVGFYKPHLPFIFPEEFLNVYPLDRIRLPPNEYAPNHMPEVAWTDYGELRDYKDIKKLGASGAINTTLPDDVVRTLRRGYYSCVSYVDSLVGTVLQELRELGLENSTIISFIGDHGWHLGENCEWTKQTNFEQATHSPMIIRVPGVTDAGLVSDTPVEHVDLYPTLVDAAGLPSLSICPKNSTLVPACREGKSLMPLAHNKSMSKEPCAFSQYPRHGDMGYSIRTDRYRYTEWAKFLGKPVYKPNWDILVGVELYDHKVDPDENNNVAYKPSYSSTRRYLSRKLRTGWRGESQYEGWRGESHQEGLDFVLSFPEKDATEHNALT